MKMCPSCGGIIGQDCFNPDECAYITMQQEQERQRLITLTAESIEERVAALERRLAELDAKLHEYPNKEPRL